VHRTARQPPRAARTTAKFTGFRRPHGNFAPRNAESKSAARARPAARIGAPTTVAEQPPLPPRRHPKQTRAPPRWRSPGGHRTGRTKRAIGRARGTVVCTYQIRCTGTGIERYRPYGRVDGSSDRELPPVGMWLGCVKCYGAYGSASGGMATSSWRWSRCGISLWYGA